MPRTSVSNERDVISNLDGLSNLKVLNPRGTPVTGAGFEHLRPSMQLETLYLEHTAVVGKGLEHLVALPNLSSLKLRSTPLDEDGIETIGKLRQVKTLSLYATDITDDHLRHLATVTNLESFLRSGLLVPRGAELGTVHHRAVFAVATW